MNTEDIKQQFKEYLDCSPLARSANSYSGLMDLLQDSRRVIEELENCAQQRCDHIAKLEYALTQRDEQLRKALEDRQEIAKELLASEGRLVLANEALESVKSSAQMWERDLKAVMTLLGMSVDDDAECENTVTRVQELKDRLQAVEKELRESNELRVSEADTNEKLVNDLLAKRKAAEQLLAEVGDLIGDRNPTQARTKGRTMNHVKRNKQAHSVEIIKGVEGLCVVLNDYRIAGPKPWGGGTVIARFKTSSEDIEKAMNDRRITMALRRIPKPPPKAQ